MIKKTERLLSFIFGVVFITVLLTVTLVVKNPTPFQYIVLRIILALAAAGIAVTFSGFLEVTISTWIRAGGALAVFVIVFFYNPVSLAAPKDLPTANGPSNSPQAKAESIPPDRLLQAEPFRVRMIDCPKRSCDVEFIVRGYDSRGRLRYDHSATFKNWTTGQFRDTIFNSIDKMYFEHQEKISFQVYCRSGNSKFWVGDQRELDWRPWNEGNEAKNYAVWLECAGDDFKSSVGIGVNVATSRINEPPVKNDPGQPK